MGAQFGESENHPSEGSEAADDADLLLSKPTKSSSLSELEANSLSNYLSLINQYLSVFMTDNATFLAERCVAQFPSSPDARYSLALCYFRSGHVRRTLLALEPARNPTPAMRYLAAQSALQLKEYAKAETVLLKECRFLYQKYVREQQNASHAATNHAETVTPAILDMDDWIVQTTPCPLPNGAAGLALLATICRKSNRKERAIKYYQMSLQLDPFLWTSFQALCELGVTEMDCNAALAFGVAPFSDEMSASTCNRAKPNTWSTAKTPLQPIETPSMGGTVLRNHFETPGLTPISVNHSIVQSHVPETPQPRSSMVSSMLPPLSNPMVLRRARDVAARRYYPPTPETPMTNVTRNMRYLRGLGPHNQSLASEPPTHAASTPRGDPHASSSIVGSSTQRHLFMSASSENQSRQIRHAATTAPGAMAAPQNHVPPPDDDKPAAAPTSISSILEILALMGTAYQKLCQYQCHDALALLRSLPQCQQTTGWALHQQGRAYLEMNDFANAQRCLELMLHTDPGRLQGLEILSTAYWHMKKEVELAHLSQRVIEMNRLSPEAWCVVGNCFSLQKDHESALAFFKRSLQLDPDFTYTHTLSGHEYMANEDFEKATACFRQALRVDERHYNAWYGLGTICHRQEKYDLAEYHFEKAVSINPSSSVLRCNLGMAQHANGKSYQALETLAVASQLDPRNPQTRFQRATIYSALQRYNEALAELIKVRDAAPREATIHFAMGKVLKRLGRPEDAMKCFLTAMDLDPKDNQIIKAAMDKLDEQDVDEETIAGF